MRWFEDAEAVRRPKVTKGDHSVLVQKPLWKLLQEIVRICLIIFQSSQIFELV